MSDLLARGNAEHSVQFFEGKLFSLREDDECCQLLVVKAISSGGLLTEEPEYAAPGGVPAKGAFGFE